MYVFIIFKIIYFLVSSFNSDFLSKNYEKPYGIVDPDQEEVYLPHKSQLGHFIYSFKNLLSTKSYLSDLSLKKASEILNYKKLYKIEKNRLLDILSKSVFNVKSESNNYVFPWIYEEDLYITKVFIQIMHDSKISMKIICDYLETISPIYKKKLPIDIKERLYNHIIPRMASINVRISDKTKQVSAEFILSESNFKLKNNPNKQSTLLLNSIIENPTRLKICPPSFEVNKLKYISGKNKSILENEKIQNLQKKEKLIRSPNPNNFNHVKSKLISNLEKSVFFENGNRNKNETSK